MKDAQVIHERSRETYGSPRVYEELKAQGISCGQNRVARLMQANGIQAKQVKRKKVTTKANEAHPVAPNLLNGDFTAERPDEKWLTDITYIPTAEGWLYLALVMDLFTRRIVLYIIPTGAANIRAKIIGSSWKVTLLR